METEPVIIQDSCCDNLVWLLICLSRALSPLAVSLPDLCVGSMLGRVSSRPGRGDAEEGLSRELSCELAASHLPGWLLCSSARQQPMGYRSISAVGLAQ